VITIDKWAGLVTNASPYVVPPGGSVVQINFQCLRPGELTSRLGQKMVTVSGGTSGSTSRGIVEVYTTHAGTIATIVYCNVTGDIYVTTATTIGAT